MFTFYDFCEAVNTENEMRKYEIATEAKLTAAQRRALPATAFGLPESRKYPIVVKDENGEYEWTHLKDAIAYFNTCRGEDQKKILAENIARVIAEYNVDIVIGPNNRIRKYADFSHVKDTKDE